MASNNLTDYKCPDGIYIGVQDNIEKERITVVNCYGNHLIYRSPMHQHAEDGMYSDYKQNVDSTFLDQKTYEHVQSLIPKVNKGSVKQFLGDMFWNQREDLKSIREVQKVYLDQLDLEREQPTKTNFEEAKIAPGVNYDSSVGKLTSTIPSHCTHHHPPRRGKAARSNKKQN